MKISVAIPLYNKEKYIGRAITSVLKQTVQPDEIIVVDDGSADHSVREVQKFNDARIRLVQQENRGEGAARNRAVEEATHELVAFLDADDEWKPDFLLHIRELYEKFPDCGAYATAYEMMLPNGRAVLAKFKGIPAHSWIGIIPDFFKVAQEGSPFCSSSVALSRKIFQSLKGFPEGIKQGADRMLWVRLGIEFPVAFCSSSQSIYYTDIPNSALHTRYDSYPIISKMIEEMLKNNEIPSPLLADIADYNTFLKLQRIYHLVIIGRMKDARELLRATAPRRKYYFQIAYWRLVTIFPSWIVSLARVVRLQVRKSSS